MANKTLQFLRNATIYGTHEAAVTGLKAQLAAGVTAGKVGEPILARYTGEDTKEHIILGIVGRTDYEIFDNAGSSSDVDSKIAAAIDALDSSASQAAGTDGLALSVTQTDGLITAISGSIAAETYDDFGAAATAKSEVIGTSGDASTADTIYGAKAYADAAVADLDATASQTASAGNGQLALSVTEVDGKITAISGSIAADTYDAYGAAAAAKSDVIGTSGDAASANTIYGAKAYADAAVAALDVTDTAVSGQFVTAVSEADGVITVSRDNLTDAVLAGYAADTTKTGAIAATDTLEQALNKLENKTAAITVASADGTVTVTSPAGGGTDLAVNIDGTTLVKNSSTGVISTDLKIQSIAQQAGSTYASQYQLVYGDSNTPIGDVISVAKDQFLKEASFNPSTQVLTLVMYTADGSTSNITVDFKDVVIEAEAGLGLYVGESEPGVSDGTINIGIDANSEAVTISDGQGGSTTAAVLTVGADSIKVGHIQDAINYAISTLDSSVAATAASGNVYSVLTGVTATDGKLTAKTEVTLAAVAKTGAAADVSFDDTGDLFTATTVEAALTELALFDAGTY